MSENEEPTMLDQTQSSDKQAAESAKHEPVPAVPLEPAAGAPLTPPPPPEHTAVLSKLSSPPFPRNGFPLLGILASVYEHVTAVAGRPNVPSGSPRLDSPQPNRAA